MGAVQRRSRSSQPSPQSRRPQRARPSRRDLTAGLDWAVRRAFSNYCVTFVRNRPCLFSTSGVSRRNFHDLGSLVPYTTTYDPRSCLVPRTRTTPQGSGTGRPLLNLRRGHNRTNVTQSLGSGLSAWRDGTRGAAASPIAGPVAPWWPDNLPGDRGAWVRIFVCSLLPAREQATHNLLGAWASGSSCGDGVPQKPHSPQASQLADVPPGVMASGPVGRIEGIVLADTHAIRYGQ